ncbi:cytochrome b-c1 complex subunit 6, mitochondrial-like isoform X1 [Patiria miniata]|uniref:Cytochrome b-c1 complex subunit 6 n=1 Tax=Patiria miniata TaxID=46514 RepID=A0A913ZZ01_PATMI|nr:cytochrome b-c1 complex subunit 6, mitochondrial-like isoform X1 [Patiria miniata]
MAIDDERLFENDPPEEEEEEEEEDEEDIVDPRDEILENCREDSHCAGFKQEFEVCQERVTSRSNTEETCTQELFDFLHCVDHCASEKIFKHVK